MSAAAALADHDLSPEALALLRAGARDHLGYCCMPGQVVKNWAAIRECEKLGYVRFLGEHPWITDKGRTAIGEPSETEAGRLRAVAAFSRRKPPLVPAKRNDPRTDFDYRAWRTSDWRCTLVVRQPDTRPEGRTIKVGRTLDGDAQYLGDRNSQVQPESEGRFVLTLVPGWMTRARWTKLGVYVMPIFSTYPRPLDELDSAFTEADRATWNRLRQVCNSINARIRNAGRRQTTKLPFGATA